MLLSISITHIQLHIYGFSLLVRLFGSSQSTEKYLGGEDRIPCNHSPTKQFKSAYKEFEMARLHQQIYFISVLHLLTLSGRFMVGFGVGHISNMIEHYILGTDSGYLNSEPSQYVSVAT